MNGRDGLPGGEFSVGSMNSPKLLLGHYGEPLPGLRIIVRQHLEGWFQGAFSITNEFNYLFWHSFLFTRHFGLSFNLSLLSLRDKAINGSVITRPLAN